MFHVYAYVLEDVKVADLTGRDGFPLRTVAAGRLAAVVSEHGKIQPADGAAVLAHAHVVDAVSQRTPAVPVRFGHVAAGVTALTAAIEARAEELERLLADIGRHVEMAVHADHPPRKPPPRPSSPGGRAYLEARLAAERARRAGDEAARERLADATRGLDALARATRTVATSRGMERCFLVDRSSLAEFLAAARHTASDTVGLRLSGPWPPYSFVTKPEEART